MPRSGRSSDLSSSGRAGFRKISKPITTAGITPITNWFPLILIIAQVTTEPSADEGKRNREIEIEDKRPVDTQDTLPLEPQKGKKRTRRQSTSAVPVPMTSSSSAAIPVPMTSSNDHQSTETHHLSKRKKKSLEEDSQIQINSSPKEKEKTKAYYPKISFDPHEVIKILKANYSPVTNRRKSDQKTRRSSRGSGGTGGSSGDGVTDFTHEVITTTLVNQICQQELNGLKSYFSDEDRYRTKDSVTVHLYKILEDLTSVVADNLPSDVIFTPELSSREFQKLEQMNEVLMVCSFLRSLLTAHTCCVESSIAIRNAPKILSGYTTPLLGVGSLDRGTCC